MVTRKVRCFRCGFPWTPRTAHPVSCPNCHSRVWHKMKPCCVQSLAAFGPNGLTPPASKVACLCGRAWQFHWVESPDFERGEWRIVG